MIDPSLGAELVDVYLGMDREVCWVVVRWDGGVCHLTHHSIVEKHYLTNTNQNYKMVHVSSRVHGLIIRSLRPHPYVYIRY